MTSEARERLTKLCERIEYLPATPYWMARIEDAADIRQLLAENARLSEGVPLGPIIGASTIVEQEIELKQLRAKVAELEAALKGTTAKSLRFSARAADLEAALAAELTAKEEAIEHLEIRTKEALQALRERDAANARAEQAEARIGVVLAEAQELTMALDREVASREQAEAALAAKDAEIDRLTTRLREEIATALRAEIAAETAAEAARQLEQAQADAAAVRKAAEKLSVVDAGCRNSSMDMPRGLVNAWADLGVALSSPNAGQPLLEELARLRTALKRIAEKETAIPGCGYCEGAVLIARAALAKGAAKE